MVYYCIGGLLLYTSGLLLYTGGLLLYRWFSHFYKTICYFQFILDLLWICYILYMLALYIKEFMNLNQQKK